MTPDVLYEDNHLLVVVKPRNMPVMGDESGDPDLLAALKAWRKEKDAKPGNVFLGLVHRLDRPVGGVMVFAKTSKAASRLSEQIRLRQPDKEYLAVVSGIPAPGERQMVDFLLKDEQTRNVRVVDKETPGAKEARLLCQVRESVGGHSLLDVRIETGRPHQIRVQLAARGMPILGDMRYGGSERMPHIALWCAAMEVNHPTGGHRLRFEAAPPEEWPWTLFKNHSPQNRSI